MPRAELQAAVGGWLSAASLAPLHSTQTVARPLGQSSSVAWRPVFAGQTTSYSWNKAQLGICYPPSSCRFVSHKTQISEQEGLEGQPRGEWLTRRSSQGGLTVP